LGDRSMVGQCPLEAFIQVRILVAQPTIVSGQGSGIRDQSAGSARLH
jgi:hypothetical protein